MPAAHLSMEVVIFKGHNLFFGMFCSLNWELLTRVYCDADANQNMHLGSGILIAVPVPKQHAASGKVIESAIQQSLKEAEYSPNSLLSFLFLYVCACTCSWVNMYVYEQYNVNLIICTLFLSDKIIIGNAITPFILDRVKVLTGGSSLEASIL